MAECFYNVYDLGNGLQRSEGPYGDRFAANAIAKWCVLKRVALVRCMPRAAPDNEARYGRKDRVEPTSVKTPRAKRAKASIRWQSNRDRRRG